MSELTERLEFIAQEARVILNERDSARERVLPLCREIIRHSGKSIRAVHRQEYTQAEEILGSARSLLKQMAQVIAENKELSYAGIVRDAQKEFTEASITFAIISGKSLPTPEQLGVDPPAYLNGLGEAVGELRRYLLDNMRRGDLSRGEEILSVMDDIYGVLVTMDFPDAVTGGLRRTTDLVRGVLERTRSDLTLSIRQQDLEVRLADFYPGE